MSDERFVTVEVATELLEGMAEWSEPVQVKIERARYSATGWSMILRRYPPERKRKRRPATDEVLSEFAMAYRERYEPGRMREFAETIGYTERHAWRLKALAIERGLLEGRP